MAATHFGNRQICNRQHKVTGQAIATHGYTLRHGWQEGACYGSGGKPIEISCDLIEGALHSARRYISTTGEKIIHLKSATPLDKDGRIGTVFSKMTRTGHTHEYMEVAIGTNAKGQITLIDHYSMVVKTYSGYSDPKTEAQAVRILADKRVAYLEHTITEAEENIVYLADRLKNWKPAELRPISQAERAAGAPKLHLMADKYGFKRTTACSRSGTAAQSNVSRAKTDDHSQVTCAACIKEIASRDKRAAEKATAAA